MNKNKNMKINPKDFWVRSYRMYKRTHDKTYANLIPMLIFSLATKNLIHTPKFTNIILFTVAFFHCRIIKLTTCTYLGKVQQFINWSDQNMVRVKIQTSILEQHLHSTKVRHVCRVSHWFAI